MHRDLPHEVRKAVTDRAEVTLDDIVRMIDRSEITDINGCYRFIDESHADETDVADLDLDRQLTLLEYHADDYDLEVHVTSARDLRATIEGLSADLVYYLANSEARIAINELDELMRKQGFDFEDIAERNPYSWASHFAERDENGCEVYEYRNIEGEIHADVWEKELFGEVRVFLIQPVDSEDVSAEERSWTP